MKPKKQQIKLFKAILVIHQQWGTLQIDPDRISKHFDDVINVKLYEFFLHSPQFMSSPANRIGTDLSSQMDSGECQSLERLLTPEASRRTVEKKTSFAARRDFGAIILNINLL